VAIDPLDPLALVQESRPKSAMPLGRTEPGSLRRVRQTIVQDHEGNEIPVEQLDGRNPAVYASRIPPPPCAQCNQDHNPIAEAQGRYDHSYLHPDKVGNAGLVIVPSGPQASAAVPPTPPAAGASAPSSKRVSIFPGRGDDDYILVVERREADDWEDDYKRKLPGNILAYFLPVLRALDVKLKDRTGGDLVEIGERELA
jgi:hypothetical protein